VGQRTRGPEAQSCPHCGCGVSFRLRVCAGTHGADGDALDVLVLSDEPLFPLCLVQARLIGVIEAEQTQEGKTIRNDRMVAVAVGSRLYANVNELDDLPPTLMDEIEQFFINYNKMRGRVFKPTARGGAVEGMNLVKRSTAKVAKKNARGSSSRSGSPQHGLTDSP
jgi:inorganic pyrophosphatase